ncbi:MAG: ABC transporter substrate-binding protein [Monoglobaceae bacterium]
MKLKKFFTLAMASVMTLGVLSGCGGKQENGQILDESIEEAMETPYEINWYFYASNQDQNEIKAVENEINNYIKDKINATVKMNILESSQYSSQLTNMIQAGEYFDMCFVSSWMLNYTESAEMGAFVPLDDYLEKYMPKTYELSDKNALECSKVKGKLYALPVIKENAECYGWIYRKDIAEKYNIDMTKIKSFEELEPYLLMIKEKEPGIENPIDWDGDTSPAGGILQQRPITSSVIGVKNDSDLTVMNLMETEERREAMRLAHRFYKEGLVKEDILTASTELNSRMKAGKTFCHMSKLKPGKAQELYKDSNYEFEQAEITAPRKGYSFGTGSMTAVSATSKNPARVMRFIELLNTDEYLNNLVVYGIEGKDFEKMDDGRVKISPNAKYGMSGSQWMLANVFITYPTSKENVNKNEVLKKFDENAALCPFTGFTFITEPVQTELASCANVNSQYINQLMLGAVDPDSVYDKYMSEMKKAGMDTIIEELQSQLDEYMANKKK